MESRNVLSFIREKKKAGSHFLALMTRKKLALIYAKKELALTFSLSWREKSLLSIFPLAVGKEVDRS